MAESRQIIKNRTKGDKRIMQREMEKLAKKAAKSAAKRQYKREMPELKPRRERRAEARKNKEAFKPELTTKQGVFTYEEFHGVGYERFNDKYTTIKETEAEAAK
jgi:type IV secretory pathway VirB9-like protein